MSEFTIKPHTAPMTGAAWFIVVDEYGSQIGPYYDDRDDAQAAIDAMTQPAFNVGDRCFSHYTKNTAAGVSGWGTIEKINNTDRGRTHGVTGTPLDDTTWYWVRTDEGTTELLDDAHGNWDMARIVTPEIAEKYGYGKDPSA
jgi:hypothetical protein